MDIFEALYTRRSIRKYTAEPVSENDLKAMLKAAMLAPSARDERPWHFVILRDAAKRKEISKTTPYTGMAEHAPLVVIVCGDMEAKKSEGFWVQDCSAAIENLMLAARGLNLGSVWCGLYPVKDRVDFASKILGLPGHIIPMGMVCIGHPAQEFREADRFMEDRVHMEEW